MSHVHTVARGECLLSIAAKFGFQKWQTIYDHPQNAALKALRPNPNVLAPGDRVFIPDKRKKVVPRPTEQIHTFTLAPAPCLLRVVVEDEDGKPLSNKPYTLTLGGVPAEGTTGGDGLIERAIPSYAARAGLSVWLNERSGPPDIEFDLALGDLDPIDEVTGVAARLSNLGYSCDAGGADERRLAAALRAFQEAHGLRVTGEIDGATKAKLADVHRA